MVKLFCELLKIVLARSCSLLFKGLITFVAWEKKMLCSKIIALKTFNFRFNGLPIYVNGQLKSNRRNSYSKKRPWRKDRLVLFKFVGGFEPSKLTAPSFAKWQKLCHRWQVRRILFHCNFWQLNKTFWFQF